MAPFFSNNLTVLTVSNLCLHNNHNNSKGMPVTLATQAFAHDNPRICSEFQKFTPVIGASQLQHYSFCCRR